MTYSDEQLAIFKWFRELEVAIHPQRKKTLVVRARAGTGKTTTIKASFSHAPESRILYCVFNKKNQLEAASKIKDRRVEVRTHHSLGNAFIRRVWQGVKPDDEIEYDRCVRVLGREDRMEVAVLRKLVSRAKNTTIAPTADDLFEIVVELDLLESDPYGPEARHFVDAALRVLELSKVQEPDGRISFDDMVWLPLALNIARPWYDLVVVDEAQDMNLPQLTMVRRAVKPGGRLVVVGDDRQAIYGFRGAVQDAMGMMKQKLDAEELGLTTTYRCPKRVVEIAREIVPDYHAAPSAPEGEVLSMPEQRLASEAKPGDAILSRMNAPLMPLALDFIKRGVPARIEGKDVGRQLLSMVKSFKPRSVPHFLEKVETWRVKQRVRLSKAKNPEKRLEQVEDMASVLKSVAEGCANVSNVEQRIGALFDDTDGESPSAVILSSVHKAKGLEWPRVFLIVPTFRKGKGTEEDNIWYVAVTRAMRSLIFVGAPGKDDDAPGRREPREGSTPPAAISPSSAVPSYEQQAGRMRGLAAEALAQNCLPPVNKYEAVPFARPPVDDWRLPGEIVRHGGSDWVCERVTESSSTFRRLSPGRVTQDMLTLSSTRHPKEETRRLSRQEYEAFFSGQGISSTRSPARDDDHQAGQTNQTESETDMNKNGKGKGAAKKQAGGKTNQRPEGKMAFVERLLTQKGSDRMTKSAVVAAVIKQFPGTPEKTARNTVNWVSAVGLPRKGKTSTHLEEEATAKPAAKKSAKAPAKKDAKGSKKAAAKAPAKKAAAKVEKTATQAELPASAPSAPAGGPPPRRTPPPAASAQPEG